MINVLSYLASGFENAYRVFRSKNQPEAGMAQARLAH